MRKYLSLVVGGAAIALSAVVNAAGSAPSPLPAGSGRDVMLRVCSTCHAPEIVAIQRLSRDGWMEVVNLMADQGAVASDAELAEITEYLAESFPASETLELRTPESS